MMGMPLKISEVKVNLATCVRAGLVALIKSSPGIGKSAAVAQVAADYRLKVIDIRLAQSDPTDLNGFPDIDRERGRAGYKPFDTFPLEGDPVPEGYDGWLIFFDELTSAPRAVQAASYKVILDQMVGQKRLHQNVRMAAAGNLETDGAIVEELSTALQSRMIHFEMMPDLQEFLDWAASNNIDNRICSYLKFMPEHIYSFVPDHTDHTYACPRTWEFVDRLIKKGGLNLSAPNARSLLAGTISEGVAREFLLFCKIYEAIPTMEQIQRDPKGTPVPDEPSMQWAISGALASHMTAANADALMTYSARLPMEFQVFEMRDIIRRKRDIMGHPAIQKWILDTAVELF